MSSNTSSQSSKKRMHLGERRDAKYGLETYPQGVLYNVLYGRILKDKDWSTLLSSMFCGNQFFENRCTVNTGIPFL